MGRREKSPVQKNPNYLCRYSALEEIEFNSSFLKHGLSSDFLPKSTI